MNLLKKEVLLKMELLTYFQENWGSVTQLCERYGLQNAFYPIVLPEIDDQRFIDPSLPTLKTQIIKLWEANITNPPANNFEGIILNEQREELLQDKLFLVQVTYLKLGEVYQVQCVKEIGLTDNLSRYYTISIPTKVSASADLLQKAFNDLESLLGDES